MSFRSRAHSGRVGLWALLFLLAAGGQSALAQSDSAIRFAWALVYRDTDDKTKAIDYEKDVVTLASGSRFTILLKPLSNCRIYLYLHDAQGNLRLLFPKGLTFPEADRQIDRTYRLPAVDDWYYLDERSGTEVFYLVASRDPLRTLEARTLAHLGQGPKGGAAERAKRRVLDEIRRLVKASSPLGGAVDRPITVAGDFRGVQEEDELSGRIIDTERIYVTTIRLRH